MATFEIIATAVDNASGVLKGVGTSGSNAAGMLERNWGKVAIAGAAAGAALEGMARNVAPLNQTIRNLSDSTDMTEAEVRGLTASLVDATFPAKEVTALLEQGRQQGLKTGEQLKEFASFWDMVGDATGESSEELAKAGVALRALGIEAGNESEALSSLGYVMRESTVDATQFLSMIGRMAPELREAGVTIDDTTALFGALEARGTTGRQAMQELRSAIRDGSGSLEEMQAELGITNEEFKKHRRMVDESSEAIQEASDRNEEGVTALQHMAAWLDKAKVAHGGLLESAAALAPVLMALGPALKAVTMAKAALNAVFLASPIGLIILAVAALAAAAYIIYRNWEPITDFFRDLWDWVKDIFWKAVEWIKWLFLNTTPQGLIFKHWEPITAFFKKLWAGVIDVFRSAWDRIKAIVDRVMGAVRAVQRAREAVTGAVGRAAGAARDRVLPSFHTGGIYRAPTPGGEGLALLQDGERVTPRGTAASGEGNRIVVDQRGLFDGANIRMVGRDDARSISEEIYSLTRSRFRAAGVTL